MYLAFKHSHFLFGYLSLALTLIWSAVAWRSTADTQDRARRLSYTLNQACAGLAALTGLAIIAIGLWRTLLFPYLGMLLFVARAVSAAWSRRAISQSRRALAAALLVQNGSLWIAAYLMHTKPF